jgi:hemoglobin/transferrin/lactoferrin receptor protein
MFFSKRRLITVYRIIIIALFWGYGYNVRAQIVNIIDAETLRPLELATVLDQKSGIILKTNSNGRVDISSFKESSTIVFRCIGYKTLNLSYRDLISLNFRVIMAQSIPQFDDIVVSASRWNQSNLVVPSKISTIRTTDVELFNPQTAADMLTISGEVFMQKSQQGGGSPMIRGFSANRLLYVVDGIRMNSAIFRSGNIQNVISIDPFSVENTEVLFGPGSVIYGSDAIGGVMNFQTLSPQFSLDSKIDTKVNIVSRYSSANHEFTNHLDFNIALKKWACITSITYNKYGDLKMGSKGPDEYLRPFIVKNINGLDIKESNDNPLIQRPSAFNQLNILQKVRFKPSRYWELELGSNYSETSAYARYDKLIETQENGFPALAQWDYGPQIWALNQLSINHGKKNRFSDRWVMRLAHQYFEESRLDRQFNKFVLKSNLEQVNALSVNFDLEKKIKNHILFYGFEGVINDVKSKGSASDIRTNSSLLLPDRYPQSKWRSTAAYFNYQYNFSEKLFLQSGLRLATYRINADFTRHLTFYNFDFDKTNTHNSATTGSLGLVVVPDKDLKLNLNLSSGFRAPNVDDIGKIFDFSLGEIVVPNTDLKAEYAWNAEIGLNKKFGNFFKIDLTAFYTYLDKAMVRRPFEVNNQDSIMYNGVLSKVYAIQNAAYGYVYGFNTGFDLKTPYGFNFSTRYNYQIGNEQMDNGTLSRSRHAAPAFGQSSITYTNKWLNLQIYAVYNAQVSNKNLNLEEQNKLAIYAIDRNGNPYSPSWTTLNFKTLCNLTSKFSITGGLENIFDVRYRPYSSGLVAPGRNFIISLKAKL